MRLWEVLRMVSSLGWSFYDPYHSKYINKMNTFMNRVGYFWLSKLLNNWLSKSLNKDFPSIQWGGVSFYSYFSETWTGIIS